MPNEPLIFVEVALTKDIPQRIDNVLALKRDYRCRRCGNDRSLLFHFELSKRFSGHFLWQFSDQARGRSLRQELPNLSRFVALSPVPGLMKWMSAAHPNWPQNLQEWMKTSGREGRGIANRFHPAALEYMTVSAGLMVCQTIPWHDYIGNGAFLEQLNYGGDRSQKA